MPRPTGGAALAWLSATVDGHCGITTPSQDPRSCENALSGSVALSAAAKRQGWQAAAEECLGHCAGCANCQYITVTLEYADCSWYALCDTTSIKPEKLFRTAAAPKAQSVAERLRRVALVFFGKHGQEEHLSSYGRSIYMDAFAQASPRLVRLAYRSWQERLIEANHDARFEVIMHSWSPEVAPLLSKLWGGAVSKQQHEPTRYARNSSTDKDLAYRCAVPQINCERTRSQLLSIYKALALKTERELEAGWLFDAVLVARHDLVLRTPLRLPAAAYAAAGAQVWLPHYCPGACRAEDGGSVGGRHCPTRYGLTDPRTHAWMVLDWLFLGTSLGADAMGDVARRLDEYRTRAEDGCLRWGSTATRPPQKAAAGSGLLFSPRRSARAAGKPASGHGAAA